MYISVYAHTYWMKEACTCIRFTFALLTLAVLMNFIIKCIFLKRLNIIDNKIIILSFLLALICGNTSEYNIFVVGFLVGIIIILALFKPIKTSKKILHFLFSSLLGLGLGAFLILINPTFIEITYNEGRVGLSFAEKTIGAFLPHYLNATSFPNIVFFVLIVLSLLILRKMYVKNLYKEIVIVSLTFFVACNAFYLFLYYFSKDIYELAHGDLKLLFIASMMYNVLFLYGLIMRKIKNNKVIGLINIIFVLVLVSVLYVNRNTISAQIVKIRKTNLIEQQYIKMLEKDFLSQYGKKEVIILKLDTTIPKIYRESYINSFLPIIYKQVKPDTYTVEWTE